MRFANSGIKSTTTSVYFETVIPKTISRNMYAIGSTSTTI